MFYLKHKGKKLEIYDDNVFTICPQCGKEHCVDIQDVLAHEGADLFGTAVYCKDCTIKNRRANPPDLDNL